jgi:RNA polymerase sigma-70 factor (ECF subfamily)
MTDARADFAAIYANHGQPVYRFALYLCGEPAEAEDIAAETFARAWTSPTPLLNETVRGYLLTIVRNVYRQRAQRAARLERLEDRSSDRPTADRRMEARDELRSINDRLRQMPADDRVALLMRADGNSYEEIAAALGTSPAAARVRVHRVRAVLTRAKLGGTP